MLNVDIVQAQPPRLGNVATSTYYTRRVICLLFGRHQDDHRRVRGKGESCSSEEAGDNDLEVRGRAIERLVGEICGYMSRLEEQSKMRISKTRVQ